MANEPQITPSRSLLFRILEWTFGEAALKPYLDAGSPGITTILTRWLRGVGVFGVIALGFTTYRWSAAAEDAKRAEQTAQRAEQQAARADHARAVARADAIRWESKLDEGMAFFKSQACNEGEVNDSGDPPNPNQSSTKPEVADDLSPIALSQTVVMDAAVKDPVHLNMLRPFSKNYSIEQLHAVIVNVPDPKIAVLTTKEKAVVTPGERLTIAQLVDLSVTVSPITDGGTALFTYRVVDPEGREDSAEVNIVVNPERKE